MALFIEIFKESITKAHQIGEEITYINNLFKSNQEMLGFQYLIKIIQENSGNLYVMKMALEILQIVNEEKVFANYSLDDIESFYQILYDLYPFDYDLVFEYAYFLTSIQDKEKEAFLIVKNLARDFQAKQEEFESFHNFNL